MRAWLLGLVVAATACKGGDRELDGTRLFAATCARCHGENGHGDPLARAQLGVPDMTDAAWQARHSDADIRRTVIEGSRSKKMPAFGSFYDERQLAALVAHVRSFR